MSVLYSLTVLAGVLFLPPEKGHLYLDPGSGSFILQLAIATVLGGLFVIKGYWSKFVGLFRKDKKDSEEPDEK